ncbi:MAG: hypothetical protein JST40_14565 [Armatimonadetes bacterium]|nr:hypothetical protein [Armatimonadota bacterium]
MKIPKKLLFTASIIAMLSTYATADSPELSRINDNVEVLKARLLEIQTQNQIEREGLENRLKMLQAQGEINQLQWPNGQSKPLGPDVSSFEGSYELAQTMQAQRAFSEVADKIASIQPIKDENLSGVACVVCADEGTLAKLQLLPVVSKKLAEQKTALNATYQEAKTNYERVVAIPNFIPAAPVSVLSNLADFVGYLRNKVTVHFGGASVDNLTAAIFLNNSLKDKGSLSTMAEYNYADIASEEILQDFFALDELIAKGEILKSAMTDAKQDVLKPAIARLDSDIGVAKSTRKALAGDSIGTDSLVIRLATLQRIKRQKPKYYYLVKVNKTGGGTRMIQGYFNSGSLSYSGGVCVNWVIMDADLNELKSGNISAHKGWQTIEDGEGDLKYP